ncbi:putative inorganic phosphate cotransporter isoform X2 [Rhagoletis pomonella]|uniref:putative inorganic phosphate cotransporter isoform X2 n=1 Tax=Rhagoletis pomonella TaxID=28610 RepID=UPI0017859966|nr:putative inorganic phosphate cotransporter isoform X2 [Rhagoletis pomonella]
MDFKKSMDIQKTANMYEKPNAFGVRHVQALLMFLGMMFGYFLRVNISAAIVPMTKPDADGTYFNWDTATKSLILSSFFWGYVLAQIPAGLLAKRFGGKIVLGVATLLASVITMLHPWAASGGSWQIVCTLRVLIGLTQGVLYPAVHTLLAKWVPRTERSFMATTVYSGAQLGTVIILGSSGAIFDSSMGWPGIFYISGAIALAWSLLFLYFGADDPQKSKVISSQEREYIEKLTGSGGTEVESMPVPWKSFFTSAPFYGLIAAQSGFTWGFYTLLTQIPTYMDSVLKLNVTSNALLSALPYFVMWLLCLIFSPISDMLINRNVLSTTTARKLFNTIGQWIPMACLIAMSYMTSAERIEAITLLTVGVGFNASAFCGYLVNHMDLSPNFAGPMMSITNGVANLLSVFAPLVVGAIVVNEKEPSEWRIVFFITAGVYLVCNALFIIFGQATVQPWNEPNIKSNIATSETTTIDSSTLGHTDLNTTEAAAPSKFE